MSANGKPTAPQEQLVEKLTRLVIRHCFAGSAPEDILISLKKDFRLEIELADPSRDAIAEREEARQLARDLWTALPTESKLAIFEKSDGWVPAWVRPLKPEGLGPAPQQPR